MQFPAAERGSFAEASADLPAVGAAPLASVEPAFFGRQVVAIVGGHD